MRQRIITAVALILISTVIFIILPQTILLYIMPVLLFICIQEWCSIIKVAKYYLIPSYAISLAIYIIGLIVPWFLLTLIYLVLINYAYAVYHMIKFEQGSNSKISQKFLLLISPIISAVTSILIIKTSEVNLLFTPFIFALIIVSASDSGAYFIGKLLGRHKMAKRISPNKTWEGFIGGLITSIILGLLFYPLLASIDLSLTHLILTLLLTSISSVIGDLFISVVKRQNNIKDTGNILPGHGGILDRIDGLLFALPVFYIFVFLLK